MRPLPFLSSMAYTIHDIQAFFDVLPTNWTQYMLLRQL